MSIRLRVYPHSTDDRRVLRGIARRKDSGGGHVVGSYAETRGHGGNRMRWERAWEM